MLLVVGSFAEGGVADYAIQVLGEFKRRGVKCVGLSLCESVLDEREYVVDSSLNSHSLMRISSTVSWSRKIKLTNDWCAQNEVTSVFLQYVPFSFHRKGLSAGFVLWCHRLPKKLARIWVFHEGHCSGVLGLLQFVLGWIAVKLYAPSSALFAAEGYRERLSHYGVNLVHCPIPSGIPVCYTRDVEAVADAPVVVFGSFPANSSAIDFALKSMRRILGSAHPKLIRVGRCSQVSAEVLKEKALTHGYHYQDYGLVDVRRLSLILSQARVGLSFYTCPFVGKSSSIAAFVTHGCPVYVFKDSLDEAQLELVQVDIDPESIKLERVVDVMEEQLH